MPALQYPNHAREGRPILGHVNLMVDTFIANTNIDDLRAIVRTMLATNPPAVASTFTAAARQRLLQVNADAQPACEGIFLKRAHDGMIMPSKELATILVRTRTLYGVGLGLNSLKVLASVVRATIGHRWEGGGDMERVFAEIDADISQALQSTREELDSGRVEDATTARHALGELQSAVRDSQNDVGSWGGIYPFERAAASLEFWKL